MKASEIEQGQSYYAKFGGKSVKVRVDAIRPLARPGSPPVFHVTNTVTGRKMEWHDSDRFVAPVIEHRGTQTARTASLADSLRKKKDTGTDQAPHLIVFARAGTGKTTTLVEGLKWVKGIALDSSLTPSPQQAAVWEEMERSKDRAQSICFVAFNRAIAQELQRRVPKGCKAQTMYSMGYGAVRRAFPDCGDPDQRKIDNIIADLLHMGLRQARRKKFEVLRATGKLVDLCRMNLIDPSGFFRVGNENNSLQELAAHYDVDLNGNEREVFALVPRALEACKDVDKYGIDFADMIWLPVVLSLSVYRYDLLLVDEAQDLNRCQQELALRAGRRLILCGDDKQAIYGFAGADSESMNRMHRRLHGTDWGCVVLPLTVTYRCGKAIVREAQKLVPGFEAHEDNGEGLVLHYHFESQTTHAQSEYEVPDLVEETYRTAVQDGDMVLCRVNAPLVSECFKFLKAGRKANIRGRKIGEGLVSTIRKLEKQELPVEACPLPCSPDHEVAHLIAVLSDWLVREQRKEEAKRNPSEGRLIALQDRHDCILAFCEGCKTVDKVVAKIEAVFTDDKNQGICLSSIHKAKGLEAKRVFLLQPVGATIPHPMARSAWQREQEYNLLYVAITRAIDELVYVS